MKELILPLALTAVLASLLFPIPTAILDILLVGNLLLAAMLVASSIYITDALKLSSLPAILLLATLARLSLNVATTRLILGSGDAGQTVEAFGSVVISGSLVVGLIVFIVITLIQFLVIAKGAERVAEVAARFTLDALPGRQMSIDADVRAGVIDFDTARKRRADLQTESRFYGALDGAMKFIKGDAIAGIAIVIVNIMGGLAVGIMIHGMELQQAVQKFTLLSVGDGLVSQVPAVLNALAAGIVMTRVSKDEGSTLAGEVLGQLGQSSKVRFGIAALAALIGCLPGMPETPFFLVAGAFLFFALLAGSKAEETALSAKERRFEPKLIALIEINLPRTSAAALWREGKLENALHEFRAAIYESMGLILPLPEVKLTDDQELAAYIRLRGVKVKQIGVEGLAGKQMADALLADLRKIVKENACELIDDIMTRRALDFLDKEAPELAATVVPGIVTVTQLTEVLKGLMSEEVSIRNFEQILQSMAEFGPKVSGERALLEEARVGLRRVICSRFADSSGEIAAFALSPAIELSFLKAERENEALNTDYIELIARFLAGREIGKRVLITSKGARAILSQCLRVKELSIPVLAYEEVAHLYQLRVEETIGSDQAASEEEIIEALAA